MDYIWLTAKTRHAWSLVISLIFYSFIEYIKSIIKWINLNVWNKLSCWNIIIQKRSTLKSALIRLYWSHLYDTYNQLSSTSFFQLPLGRCSDLNGHVHTKLNNMINTIRLQSFNNPLPINNRTLGLELYFDPISIYPNLFLMLMSLL